MKDFICSHISHRNAVNVLLLGHHPIELRHQEYFCGLLCTNILPPTKAFPFNFINIFQTYTKAIGTSLVIFRNIIVDHYQL